MRTLHHIALTLAVVTLGVVGTGIAFAIFYELIATVGPARTFLVTYLAPVFAVAYGVVLLDSDNTITWGNGRLREWTGRDKVVGANFYTVLGSPEILGPDFCPFHTALATGRPSSSKICTRRSICFSFSARCFSTASPSCREAAS